MSSYRIAQSASNYWLAAHRTRYAGVPAPHMRTCNYRPNCERPSRGELSTVRSVAAADCVMKADNHELQRSKTVECSTHWAHCGRFLEHDRAYMLRRRAGRQNIHGTSRELNHARHYSTLRCALLEEVRETKMRLRTLSGKVWCSCRAKHEVWRDTLAAVQTTGQWRRLVSRTGPSSFSQSGSNSIKALKLSNSMFRVLPLLVKQHTNRFNHKTNKKESLGKQSA